MDYKKLSSVTHVTDSAEVTVDEKKKKIIDAAKRKKINAIRAVRDAARRKRVEYLRSQITNASKKSKVKDSARKFKIFKVSDSYLNLKKKIKDDLLETETTDEAVEAALSNINEDTPAEQVVAAVTEVLGETIDTLQEAVEEGGDDDLDDLPDDEPAE